MSIKLIPPGRRHGNRVFYARITVEGRRYEISTRTANPKLAKGRAERAERELWERHLSEKAHALTVEAAIDNYMGFRRPSKADGRFYLRLRKWFGKTLLADMTQAKIDEAARMLLPGRAPETWNRQIYTPMSAALKHAGIDRKVRRPKQRKPRSKAISKGTAEALIQALEGDYQVLAILLFYTGCRITEAVKLTWDRVDLQGGRVCFDLSKIDQDHWRPLHPRVVAALANLPKDGKVFPWKTRSWPSRKLSAAAKALGLAFHPHMARHSFGTWLVDAGASIRDVMDAGGWQDYKSVLRYTASDVERVRKHVEKL